MHSESVSEKSERDHGRIAETPHLHREVRLFHMKELPGHQGRLPPNEQVYPEYTLLTLQSTENRRRHKLTPRYQPIHFAMQHLILGEKHQLHSVTCNRW
jgi:hypothetical protein